MRNTFLNNNFLAALIIVLSLGVAGIITHAEISSRASPSVSVSLEKNKISGFFTLSIRASAGIKEFVLYPSGKSSYGGGVGGCLATFKSDNISFGDPGDFTPKMAATITDCSGNSVDFELFPPKDGRTIGKLVLPAVSETPSAPLATPPPSETESKPKPKPESKILANVSFPVAELGSCQSEAECVSYCDDASHAKVCIEFAKKNKIMSEEEAANLEKLADIKDGPGGCNSQKSCENYCSDIDKIDECFAFADKHNLLSEKDRDKIGKIKTALKAGAKLPGGCNNERACESYCNDANHADECLAFGEQSGFLSAQEIQQFRKFTELRKSGETPGQCSSRESCEGYCNNPDNTEECLAFAEKAGFLSGEELAQAKKVLPLLKEGKTPGACRTKQQCEAYCDDESHMDECVRFGLEAGIISPQDAEMVKKTGGRGPGGCHSKEQCQTYCEQNPRECASWAKEKGLEGEFSGPGGAGFSGPGGCKNEEECTAYCTANQEDQTCKKMIEQFGGGDFQGEPGGEGGQGFQGGPGGCKSQEECMTYCKSHQEECMKFNPVGAGEGSQGGREGFYGKPQNQPTAGIACSPKGTVASFVCAKNGKNSPPELEVTYFNNCTAKQHGAEVIHDGVCEGHKPCAEVADPVCGNDGNTWVSACYAEEQGGGVKYTGACKGQSGGEPDGNGQSSGGYDRRAGFSGPGGCKSQEECMAYCVKNPDKCQGLFLPSGTRSDTGTGSQSQGGDPGAECAKYGGAWDGKTCQRPSSDSYPKSDQQRVPRQYQQQMSPDQCSSFFSSVPNCSYVGPEDSQNYQYCKQCFPDK